METRFSKEDWQRVYDLTGSGTPLLAQDCGRLCQQACCRGGHEGYGIYLLPGESCLFTGREPWLNWAVQDASDPGFPSSWTGDVHFLQCNGRCDRALRPMQCRTYPAAPHLDEDGRFRLILETLETAYRCPILADPALRLKLSREWLHGLYQAWGMLLNEPLIYDLVWMDSEARRQQHLALKTAYGATP